MNDGSHEFESSGSSVNDSLNWIGLFAGHSFSHDYTTTLNSLYETTEISKKSMIFTNKKSTFLFQRTAFHVEESNTNIWTYSGVVYC